MGIWQNFKETDHDFEKKLLGVLLLLPISLGCFYLIDKFFQAIPNTKLLLDNNASVFGYFIIAFLVIVGVTGLIYWITLEVILETETIATKKACTINACIWALYWTVWSVFCGWLQSSYPLVLYDITITLFLLVFTPGFLMFLFARSVRKEDITEETENKAQSISNYEPFIICLERRYYCGYYGLLCLPIFLITVILLHK